MRTKIAAYTMGFKEYLAIFPASSKCCKGRSGSPDKHSSGSVSSWSWRQILDGTSSNDELIGGEGDRDGRGDVGRDENGVVVSRGTELLLIRTVASLDLMKASRSIGPALLAFIVLHSTLSGSQIPAWIWECCLLREQCLTPSPHHSFGATGQLSDR